MAVIQRAPKHQPDAAPLWLPRHDPVVVEQSSARPPDMVEGYRLPSLLSTFFLGGRWKMARTISTALAVVLFFVVLPSLFGAGIGSLIKIAFYQGWTLGLLLLVTARVRSISVGTVARYWLAGMFTVVMVTYQVNDLLSGLVSPSSVWITPVLEELLKAAPLALAVGLGRRAWRHPGLSDLMILGFAVGAGYAFHEEALWERGAASGFEFNLGLFVPSIFQQDGHFVVGQAVWTSIIGLAIGLFILHRRQRGAVVAAAVSVLVVVGDHMSVNDTESALDVVRQLLFNGKLVGLIFVVAVVAAINLDRARLGAISARDHLFPSERVQGSRVTTAADQNDPLQSLLASRYRRLRNGVHPTVDATTQQWPPRCEAHPAPIAELARLGRAADIGVGPGTSSNGWAADPEVPEGFRFVGPSGFTAYAAGTTSVELVPIPVLEHDIAEADDETRAKLEKEATSEAARIASASPTTTSISTPKVRIEARGTPKQERSSDFWQYSGLAVVSIGLYALVRLLTVSDVSNATLDTVISLPDAPNSPALIVGALGALGALGAIAAAVSLRGRGAAELDAGWAVGPGYDPSPDRPDECEA